MKITYETSREDFWNFSKYVAMRIPTYRRNILGNMIAPPLVGALVMYALGLPLILTLAVTLGLIAMIPLAFLAISKRQVTSLLSGTPGLLGEHTITIDSKGFREETLVNDSSTSWSGVVDITENQEYIFIFIEVHMAHVMPKRAFHVPDKTRVFFEAARTFWEDAVLV